MSADARSQLEIDYLRSCDRPYTSMNRNRLETFIDSDRIWQS